MNDERLMATNSGRFVALDGLRGIAALIVALGHYGEVARYGVAFPHYLAVDFFLLLSGFVLTHRYMYGSRVSFREFVIVRLARLYPLHLLTLFVFAGVFFLRWKEFPHYPDGSLFTFLMQFLLLQNVGLTTLVHSWNAPSWSISVEFWVNIVFFLTVTARTPTWLLTILSLALFCMIARQDGKLATSLHNYFGLFNSGLIRGFASFLLGVVAYRLYLREKASGRGRGFGSLRRVAVLAVAAVLVLVPRPGMDWLDFLAPPVFLACVVLFANSLSSESFWMRGLAYLGGVSYSIYLIHYPILQLILFVTAVFLHKGWDNGLGLFFVDPGLRLIPYFMIVLIASHILYHRFEIPSQLAVRRAFSRKTSQAE